MTNGLTIELPAGLPNTAEGRVVDTSSVAQASVNPSLVLRSTEGTSMTRKHFLAQIIAAASAFSRTERRAGAANRESPVEKPFLLKLSINDGKFTQEIAVSESDRFKVVSQFDNRRWTVRGTTGHVADDSLPVDLTVECFVSPTVNETSIAPRNLKLDGTWSGNMGAIGGFMLDQSARRRTVGPPAK
jgi:hypothetical protein